MGSLSFWSMYYAEHRRKYERQYVTTTDTYLKFMHNQCKWNITGRHANELARESQ
jgi:hypothetical protein